MPDLSPEARAVLRDFFLNGGYAAMLRRSPLDGKIVAGGDGSVARSYTPTWRDRLARGLLSVIAGGGGGEHRATVGAEDLVQSLVGSRGIGPTGISLADFTPAGSILGIQESAQSRDWPGAIMSAVPGAPGTRRVVGRVSGTVPTAPTTPPPPAQSIFGSLSGTPVAVADPAAKAASRPGPIVTAFATNEEIPGKGIGHLPSIIDRPYQEREAYSSWPKSTDSGGNDVWYAAVGVPTDPTLEATGAFTSASGTPEHNPARVARPWAALVGPSDNRQLSTRSLTNLNSVEATRAYMRAQNKGAYHVVIPDAPWSDRTSVRVSLPGSVTPEQIAALDSLGSRHGLFVSDTGNGVTFINPPGNLNAEELGDLLRGEWGRNISDILGVRGIDLKPVKVISKTIDYEPLFAAAHAGSGKATRELFESTTPEARAMLDKDPAVRADVAAVIKRDAEWAAATNDPARPDIQRARQIFVDRGLAGLLEELEKGIIPLPVVLAALGLGRTNDPRSEGDGL
jgi:hypothetical protein